MNKKQYNNVIENTLKHESSDDSLSTARAIFNNMGVALPEGDIKTVYETIKTDNYMSWRSCTMQEAQNAAEHGVAAIGIREDRIVVLSANDEEQPVTQTSSVMTLDDNTSAFAVDGLHYYMYSYGSTGQVGCETGNECYDFNKLFDNNKKETLLSELIAIMGTEKNVFSHYTTAECVDIVLQYDSTITNYCNIYCVPKEFVQTILLRELWCINPLDTTADEAVKSYFRWLEEREKWSNLSEEEKLFNPPPSMPVIIKEDCSTGIGQMFAFVAINANNLARKKGIINSREYNKDDWHDCKEVWFGLHENESFAIKMTTLEMHHCAECAGVCGSLYHCTETQIRAILARYNGTNDDAVDYGNKCFEYYKIFKKYQ